MEKIFNNSNYRTIENANVIFRTPKRIQSGVDFSRVVYTLDGEKLKLSFETDVFILQNGVNQTRNGQYVVDIQIDENQQSFSEFVGEMDELALGKLWENSKKWFGEQLDQDILDSFYKYPFRTNTSGGSYMRVPLDMDNLLVRNQSGTRLNLESVESGSRVKVKATFEGLEFYKQLVLPIYKISEIKVYQNNKKAGDGYSFYTYDNNLPDLVREDFEQCLETDAEDLATFHDNNEKEVKTLLGIPENVEQSYQEEEFKPEDENKEEEEENGEEQLEEENVKREEQILENNVDNEEVLENKDTLEHLEQENSLEVDLGEVESVERTVEETERDDISEILSKNLTKALDEAEQTLEIYEDDTLEDKEVKLRKMIEILKREKTGTQQSEASSDSRRSKRKVILRYSKKRVVNQAI